MSLNGGLLCQLAALRDGNVPAGRQPRPRSQHRPDGRHSDRANSIFHTAAPLKPEIQEWAEGAIHQIGRADDQQRQHCRGFQHDARLRSVNAPRRVFHHRRGAENAQHEQDGIAFQVVQRFGGGQAQAAEAEQSGKVLPRLGKTVRVEQHES